MRLLLLGYGYSARASAAALSGSVASIVATARTSAKAAALSDAGIEAIALDCHDAGQRLGEALRQATHLLVSAGPDSGGDPFLVRSRDAIRNAVTFGQLAWIGYYSTVGVYGDTGGQWVDEATPPAPASDRTRWRVLAELAWAEVGRDAGVPIALLRLAGIYGPGRNAFVNLARGTAKRLIRPGQVFNRIHVADIAGVTAAAALRTAGGVFNVSDDEPAPPQDPIAFAAELMGLPVPPDMPFDPKELSPMALTFWGESRRVGNARLRADLGYRLLYPTYREGLRSLWESGTWEGSADDQSDASPRFKRIEG